MKTQTIEIIFLYLSQGVQWGKLQGILDAWVNPLAPTLIMGDMNWHWFQDSTHCMKLYFQRSGFKQLLRQPTHDQGHCLDHIYMNEASLRLDPKVEVKATYYSDHDIISVYFPSVKMQ